MPYLINGQPLTDDRVRGEEVRIRHDPRFAGIPNEAERARRVREAAEFAAIDILLVEQVAARDSRPIDPTVVERELRTQKAIGNCRSAFDDRQVRLWIEWNFRLQRTAREMTAGASKPTAEDIESFYRQNRENFRGPAVFEAAHIVKHVNEQQSEDQARTGIEAALAELESGTAFAEVADRHSDCKGRGSDLGKFNAGTMVQEFEDAIRDLAPGQRTGIFRSPFGFHIAELRSKIPPGPVDFEEAREDIRRVLTRIQEHQEYLRVIAGIRSCADIRWIPEAQTPKQNNEYEESVASK